MLDQNTDRMWYVIGALVVGAGIILLANGTLPDIFANVAENFEGVSDKGLTVISELDVLGYQEDDSEIVSPPDVRVTSENLLTDDVVFKHALGSELIRSQGNYILRADGRSGANVGIRLDESIFEDNVRYRLTFDMTKLSGDVLSLDGHFSAVHEVQIYMNGNRLRRHAANTHPNDTNTHSYIIDFVFDADPTIKDPNIYFQPNRPNSYKMPYEVEIENLSLVTVELIDEE